MTSTSLNSTGKGTGTATAITNGTSVISSDNGIVDSADKAHPILKELRKPESIAGLTLGSLALVIIVVGMVLTVVFRKRLRSGKKAAPAPVERQKSQYSIYGGRSVKGHPNNNNGSSDVAKENRENPWYGIGGSGIALAYNNPMNSAHTYNDQLNSIPRQDDRLNRIPRHDDQLKSNPRHDDRLNRIPRHDDQQNRIPRQDDRLNRITRHDDRLNRIPRHDDRLNRIPRHDGDSPPDITSRHNGLYRANRFNSESSSDFGHNEEPSVSSRYDGEPPVTSKYKHLPRTTPMYNQGSSAALDYHDQRIPAPDYGGRLHSYKPEIPRAKAGAVDRNRYVPFIDY